MVERVKASHTPALVDMGRCKCGHQQHVQVPEEEQKGGARSSRDGQQERRLKPVKVFGHEFWKGEVVGAGELLHH